MLKCAEGCVAGTRVNEKNCTQAVSDPALLATDLVDYLVEREVPFREAHHVVGELVGLSEKLDVALNALPYDRVKQVHSQLGEDWNRVFDLQRAIAKREKPGMPGVKQVAERIAYWRQR